MAAALGLGRSRGLACGGRRGIHLGLRGCRRRVLLLGLLRRGRRLLLGLGGRGRRCVLLGRLLGRLLHGRRFLAGVRGRRLREGGCGGQHPGGRNQQQHPGLVHDVSSVAAAPALVGAEGPCAGRMEEAGASNRQARRVEMANEASTPTAGRRSAAPAFAATFNAACDRVTPQTRTAAAPGVASTFCWLPDPPAGSAGCAPFCEHCFSTGCQKVARPRMPRLPRA